MHFIDILSLSLSFLGIYGLFLSLRYLIPCYIIPFISANLSSTQTLLNHAEAINAIPPESEYRTHLDVLANRFAAMRVESNLARGPFQQLRLAIQRGLTCRLSVLYYRIEGMKSKLELAIDKQRLRVAESTTRTAVPIPAAAIATLANNVADPTLPLPATSP
ncbi:hypothetical protein DFH94DRAFT_744429 [Russula ochroleuca]|uniref:Uncharacterized protein n=1 Tax=Russula ochroleuca TaxID=152965 RepID=A0A9P5MVG3_9AGAM|nr:hypothetical protein DFH94DRAFT_744429 [Russula ochroleuca]